MGATEDQVPAQQSPDLVAPWGPVPAITPSFNDLTEEIEAVFDPPVSSAYFFRLHGSYETPSAP